MYMTELPINPFRLLHIKHIFKEYQAILGFIIFSLNKSLKMPIAKLKEKFEHINWPFIDL